MGERLSRVITNTKKKLSDKKTLGLCRSDYKRNRLIKLSQS